MYMTLKYVMVNGTWARQKGFAVTSGAKYAVCTSLHGD